MSEPRPSSASRRSFLLRKIHSLTGVAPLGVFLILHLYLNAHALRGQGSYDVAVRETADTPYLFAIEIGCVLLPLLFHAGYGIKLAFEGRPNASTYTASRNWMYSAQRLTGLLGLAFVLWHMSELWIPRVTGQLDPGAYYPTLCQTLSTTKKGLPLAALGYVFGIAACVFHFANGLWGFCTSWGITATKRSQRVSAVVFGVVGLATFILGANTAIYFATGSRIAIFGTPAEDSIARAPRLVRTCADQGPLPKSAPTPGAAASPNAVENVTR
ncbi:MAG: succinate dehydrogenase [Polyangiaceae bacterium]